MSSVKVAVRVRPLNQREIDLKSQFIIGMDGPKTSITNVKTDRDRVKEFTYDYSYWSVSKEDERYDSQEKVFSDLGQDVLRNSFEGYNSCVFAYGQTGSGKTYTMMGSPGDIGLIPRICNGLYDHILEHQNDGSSFRTEVSYMEIYNEKVRDLLRPKKRAGKAEHNLRVREHPKTGPYVEGLSQHLVSDYEGIQALMEKGNETRTTASTNMNDVSSRSHAIFTVKYSQARFVKGMPSETTSRINLVDLAGSERACATGATGIRLKEGGNINRSLVTLGNVISALAELSSASAKQKKPFIPYRDSSLTWLLKDSLGGNAKTIMVAAISPADCNYAESLSTLRYADRAKNIVNRPTVNEDANVKLIRELRAEIERLKTLIASGHVKVSSSPGVAEKLHENEELVEKLTQKWASRWSETQRILEDKSLALKREGVGVVVDSQLPHFMQISTDLLSSGVVLYHFKEGNTRIGCGGSEKHEQDIVLTAPGIEPEHCVVEHRPGGDVLLHPVSGTCLVNAALVMESVSLHQGDNVILGKTNVFRFNHPAQAAVLRERRRSVSPTETDGDDSGIIDTPPMASLPFGLNPIAELEKQRIEEETRLEDARRQLEMLRMQADITEAEIETEKRKHVRVTAAAGVSSSTTPDVSSSDDRSQCAKAISSSSNNSSLSSEDVDTKATPATTPRKSSRRRSTQSPRKHSRVNSRDETEAFAREDRRLSEEVEKLNRELIVREEELVKEKETIKEKTEALDELLTVAKERDEELRKLEETREEERRRLELEKDAAVMKLEKQLLAERKRHLRDQRHVQSLMEAQRKSFDIVNTSPQKNEKKPRESLIAIEIPTAFWNETPKESYHAYLIKLKIGPDIWTVQRRYSEFLHFHDGMKELYPEMLHLDRDFPPAKWFGNRNAEFVEKRRKGLEKYTRRMLRCCSTIPDCQLSFLVSVDGCLTKDAFCQEFPFFNEEAKPFTSSSGQKSFIIKKDAQ
ncbi:kinesin-like protein KIF16B [Oscarella lobularis]|uniref:kinesin-like protein KIF16B n=1 Tax=Oscarella lobularis TaxID=121494 RepID=UPI0033134238